MITLDTNVLARYLLKDDAAQFEKAQVIIEGPETFAIPVTVCLELVWVLEVSDCSRADIARAIRLLIGLPNVMVTVKASDAETQAWRPADEEGMK